MNKKQQLFLALAIAASCSIHQASAQIYVHVRPIAPIVVRTEQPSPRHVWVGEDWRENNGHYERGNVRLATKSTNMMNRRASKLSMELRAWLRSGDSYSRTQIGRLLDIGMTPDAIMQRYNNSKEIA